MKNRKWWDIKAATNAQGATVVELRIYDEIGFWGTTAKGFIEQLDPWRAVQRRSSSP